MPASIPIQQGFNGGKFGALVKGRTDLKRYAFGCETLQNFNITPEGAVVKRSGTRYVRNGMDPLAKSRLIPLFVEGSQSYVLEIGVGRIRVYKNEGAVTEGALAGVTLVNNTNPVEITLAAHPYITGDSVYITGSDMAELNGRFFEVTKTGANTFTLDDEDGTSRSAGTTASPQRHFQMTDGVVSDSIPWLEAELDAIQYAQNGDLIYLAHPNHPPHIITRAGDLDWTCREMTFKFVPLQTVNTDETKTVSINDFTVGAGRTLTATGFTFSASDVGRVFAIGVDPTASDFYAPWAAGRGLGAINTSVADNGTVGTGGAGTYTAGEHHVVHEGRCYSTTAATPGMGYRAPVHEKGAESDGAMICTYQNNGWGYGTITAQAGATATITNTVAMPTSVDTSHAVYTGSATDEWAWGAWDEVNGYPAAVAFFEDRLWFGGTTADPQTVWASRTGIYDDFRITPADLADTGLQFEFLSTTLNKIEWLIGGDVLYAGTRGGEFVVDSGSSTEGVTASTVRVRLQSNYGSSAAVQPRQVDSSIIFVRQNNDVHELTYDFGSDRYVAPDLTRFASDVLEPGVTQVEYQRDPFRQLWFRKSDGSAATCTYVKLEDVLAFGDVVLGGLGTSIESICVIPDPDGTESQVWFTVRRVVNGAFVRHVEYLEKAFKRTDAIADAFFVDAGLTYSDVATTTITGLWHLEGASLDVLANGVSVGPKTVTNGAITLSSPATKVQAGLPMGTTRLRTLPWVPQSSTLSTASSLGWQGRLTNLLIQVDTAGDDIEFGSDFTTMDTWTRSAPTVLYTGLSDILDLPSDFTQTRQVAIRYDEPLPLTILSISAQAEVEVR